MIKLMVTGGCGFIGSNFIKHQLNNSQNKVLNIDKLTYSSNLENLLEIKDSKNYRFVKGDIGDKILIRSIFDEFLPDVLINFAAETHVDRSIESPNVFIKTNILGTVNLLDVSLDYCKEHHFRFIHVSTDEVYGSLLSNENSFTEKSPYKPNSPYSASKASSDHLVRSWNKTYKLPSIITSCSNNYGPNQFPEKLIPLIIANCIDEKELPIYGDGTNIRDWLHVEDHCIALDLIMKKGEIGQKYNISANNEINNIDIVNNLCEILDFMKPRKNGLSYKKLIKYVEDRPGHDFRYSVDSSKIQKTLGWKPSRSFKKGIEDTVKWYIDNENWWRNIQKKEYRQNRLGLLPK